MSLVKLHYPNSSLNLISNLLNLTIVVVIILPVYSAPLLIFGYLVMLYKIKYLYNSTVNLIYLYLTTEIIVHFVLVKLDLCYHGKTINLFLIITLYIKISHSTNITIVNGFEESQTNMYRYSAFSMGTFCSLSVISKYKIITGNLTQPNLCNHATNYLGRLYGSMNVREIRNMHHD